MSFHALPLPIAQVSLECALKCGQSFRWTAYPLAALPGSLESSPKHEYRFTLPDRVVCLKQSSTTLFWRAAFPTQAASKMSVEENALKDAETLEWLRDYLQLDIDLVKLYAEWSACDPVFAKIQSRFGGVRILRQDPWENLVSFICSSNNNISRITKMVQSLGSRFSPPLLSMHSPDDSQESHAYHPFPPPSALAKPEVSAILRSLGFGYRAEFIQRTAQMLIEAHPEPGAAEEWLRGLRKLSTQEAREELLKFIGVGRKVADCILLMSLDKPEVVPVDTHVHQIAIKYYGLSASTKKTAMSPALYAIVNAKLAGIWGSYAGWAHTVLFTADLSSFQSYGLTVPETKLSVSVLPTPSPSPIKRKRVIGKAEQPMKEEEDAMVLLPQMKRRRSSRMNQTTTSEP